MCENLTKIEKSIIRKIEKSKRAFTLIELLVVIAMIAVLAASATTAVSSARKRADIARATAEVKEMTNAILAYENYTTDHSLQSVASGDWKEATEGNVGFLLGGKTDQMGQKIPILYNAGIRGNRLVDPWGRAYRYKIAPAGEAVSADDQVGKTMETYLFLPNMHRIRRD